jgi:hypothetical protein
MYAAWTAVQHGDANALSDALRRDPKCVDYEETGEDAHGGTKLLVMAAGKGLMQCIELLLAAGADVNELCGQGGYGIAVTPIHSLCICRPPNAAACIEELLAAGASPDISACGSKMGDDELGHLPLHALLGFSYDTDAKCWGASPMRRTPADREARTACAKLLLRAGANVHISRLVENQPAWIPNAGARTMRPSPFTLAKTMAGDPVAMMIQRASGPHWSPESHEFYPDAARAYAVSALCCLQHLRLRRLAQLGQDAGAQFVKDALVHLVRRESEHL